jgi:hypothetical protein
MVFPDIQANHSIGDGILAVQTEMDETRSGHRTILLTFKAQGAGGAIA